MATNSEVLQQQRQIMMELQANQLRYKDVNAATATFFADAGFQSQLSSEEEVGFMGGFKHSSIKEEGDRTANLLFGNVGRGISFVLCSKEYKAWQASVKGKVTREAFIAKLGEQVGQRKLSFTGAIVNVTYNSDMKCMNLHVISINTLKEALGSADQGLKASLCALRETPGSFWSAVSQIDTVKEKVIKIQFSSSKQLNSTPSSVFVDPGISLNAYVTMEAVLPKQSQNPPPCTLENGVKVVQCFQKAASPFKQESSQRLDPIDCLPWLITPRGPAKSFNGWVYKDHAELRVLLGVLKRTCCGKTGDDYDLLRHLVDLRLDLEEPVALKDLCEEAGVYRLSRAADQVASVYKLEHSVRDSPCLTECALQCAFFPGIIQLFLSAPMSNIFRKYCQFSFPASAKPTVGDAHAFAQMFQRTLDLVTSVDSDLNDGDEDEGKKRVVLDFAKDLTCVFPQLHLTQGLTSFDTAKFFTVFRQYLRFCTNSQVRPFATSLHVLRMFCSTVDFSVTPTATHYSVPQIMSEPDANFPGASELWLELIQTYLASPTWSPKGVWRMPRQLARKVEDFLAPPAASSSDKRKKGPKKGSQ